jgi:cysteinyl-tRNA synthetase
MAEQHLGETIDIHGGGNDLKFPHHENEIAQSVCSHDGAPFARYWVHNGFVEIDKEKMSKSLGNVLLVENLLKDYPGEALRMALIRARYRERLSWSDESVEQAKIQLDRMYGALLRLESVEVEGNPTPSDDFVNAMDDDLNTALAITTMLDAVNRANTLSTAEDLRRAKSELLGAGNELGILQQSPKQWFASAPSGELDIGKIDALVVEREQARNDKNWQRADEIRDELDEMGIHIQDGPEGTQWRTR